MVWLHMSVNPIYIRLTLKKLTPGGLELRTSEAEGKPLPHTAKMMLRFMATNSAIKETELFSAASCG